MICSLYYTSLNVNSVHELLVMHCSLHDLKHERFVPVELRSTLYVYIYRFVYKAHQYSRNYLISLRIK